MTIPSGKILVYASERGPCKRRLKLISSAAEKIARNLNMDMKVVKLKNPELTSICVYYQNGEEEPVPLYQDKGQAANFEQAYRALRDMMFVLSFHPKYVNLRRHRRRIMKFS